MKKLLASLLALTLILALAPAALGVPASAAGEKAPSVTVTTLVEPTYDAAGYFYEGLAAVKKDGKWGYIDETGKTVIDFKYDYAGEFNEGYAVVARYEANREFSTLGAEEIGGYILYLIDTAGKETPLTVHSDDSNKDYPFGVYDLENLEDQSNLRVWGGVLVVGSGAFAANGRQITPNDAELKALMNKCEESSLAFFVDFNSYGDDEPVWIYDTFPADICVNGLIPMYLVGYGPCVCYLMDKTGHIVKDFTDKIESNMTDEDLIYLDEFSAPDSKGYIRAARVVDTWANTTYRYGLIDYATGKWVVQPIYNGFRYYFDGETFGDGLWVVNKGGKFGAVSQKTMTEAIPPEYDLLRSFGQGFAAARKGSKWCLLDASGKSYSIGLPGGGTAKNILAVGSVGSIGDIGAAVVYDGDIGKGYLVATTPVNGVLPAIEGSESLPISAYFPYYDGTTDSLSSSVTPGDIMPFEKNGKYGFYKLTFDFAAPAGFTDLADWNKAPVNWAVDNKFADAKSASVFGTTDPCPRWEVVDMLWKAMGSPEPTITSVPFTDVDPAAPYFKAICWAYEKKIARGIRDTIFGTNETVERGDAMTFLYRAAKEPAVTVTATFPDVPVDKYYAAPVAWAVSQKSPITTGANGVFLPEETVKRGEMVTFLYRWIVENK